jgi:hypothetical protein
MAGAITFAVVGILLVILGGVGLNFLEHAPAKNVQLVYKLLAMGGLCVGLAIWIVVSRLRYYGNLRGTTENGGSDASGSNPGFGNNNDCGHASGDGGGGADAGNH